MLCVVQKSKAKERKKKRDTTIHDECFALDAGLSLDFLLVAAATAVLSESKDKVVLVTVAETQMSQSAHTHTTL